MNTNSEHIGLSDMQWFCLIITDSFNHLIIIIQLNMNIMIIFAEILNGAYHDGLYWFILSMSVYWIALWVYELMNISSEHIGLSDMQWFCLIIIDSFNHLIIIIQLNKNITIFCLVVAVVA